MKKAVIFDLDGTLLPMNEDEFVKAYFGLLCKKAMPFGYDKQQFINTIMKGTVLMRNNNGDATNEEVFWKYFAQTFGEDKLKDKAIFDEFYLNEFAQTKIACGFNPMSKGIVDFCRQNFKYVILASNPVFPKEAMQWRAKFAGVNLENFDYISDYSNSTCCKPNPNFLQDILNKFNLLPEEVIYIGNNEIEDGAMAKALGVEVLMVGDQIIVDEQGKYSFTHIPFADVQNKLEEFLKESEGEENE
ncbi:MAG: HAD family hydrolase [Clostridia bacterium]|nr:HAD family hydrolase [Clostridia bacterium]